MSGARQSYLVEILLPKEPTHSDSIGQEWFEGLLGVLTEKFGGVTSFVRSPGQGLRTRDGETRRL